MTTPILTKSFRASAAVTGFLIVAASGDRTVAAATAATDPLIGAADEQGAASGAMLDIDVAGFSSVRYGDDVAFGDPLTSDANGRAIKAEPVAGEIVRIIGFAMTDAEEDDVGDFWIAPGILATPEAPGG